MKKILSVAFVATCAMLLCSFTPHSPKSNHQCLKLVKDANLQTSRTGYLGTATLEWDATTPPAYTPYADVYDDGGGIFSVTVRLVASGPVEVPCFYSGTITVETLSTLSTNNVSISYPTNQNTAIRDKVYSF